jgi:hypothetical protein
LYASISDVRIESKGRSPKKAFILPQLTRSFFRLFFEALTLRKLWIQGKRVSPWVLSLSKSSFLILRASRTLSSPFAVLSSDPRENSPEVKVEELVDSRFIRKLDERGLIDRLYSTYGVK